MGRQVRQERKVEFSKEARALDSVRRSWYRRYLREGFSPAEALSKARAFTPARERMRAIDHNAREESRL